MTLILQRGVTRDPGSFSVFSKRLLVHNSGYVVFQMFYIPIVYVLDNIETNYNIDLIIIQACQTLMLQKRVS